MRLLVNIDVPDLDDAAQREWQAFGLQRGRRLGEGGLELLGAAMPASLLQQATGTIGAAGQARDHNRHWTPLHLDVAVDDLAAALARATAAGFSLGTPVLATAWGSIAVLQNPTDMDGA
ncbi:MAG: VOC family protein [Pseudoxanthomonas sp.]